MLGNQARRPGFFISLSQCFFQSYYHYDITSLLCPPPHPGIALKNPNLTSAEAIDEVKSWITANGGDAGAHKYVVSYKPLPTTIQ